MAGTLKLRGNLIHWCIRTGRSRSPSCLGGRGRYTVKESRTILSRCVLISRNIPGHRFVAAWSAWSKAMLFLYSRSPSKRFRMRPRIQMLVCRLSTRRRLRTGTSSCVSSGWWSRSSRRGIKLRPTVRFHSLKGTKRICSSFPLVHFIVRLLGSSLGIVCISLGTAGRGSLV